MDFGLSEEQALFQTSLRGYLGGHFPLACVRRVIDGDRSEVGTFLGGLAEQGVSGVLVPEEFGGSGLTLLDAAVAAEELGYACSPASAHSAVAMAPLAIRGAGTDEQCRRWLPDAAAGRVLLSFAAGAPAVRGDRLSGTAPYVPDACEADAFVVSCGEGEGRRLVILGRDTPGLRVERLLSVDDTRSLGELTFDDVEVDPAAELREAPVPALIDRTIDAGRIALAADALGASERNLEEAVRYAMTRKQFGRVVASFQAVKHMCAEAYAELEPVRSLVWYAAYAWDEGLPDAHETALLAKALACDVATSTASTAVQVFGGMGFTWECDAHLWFKRAGYDRQMLGGPGALRAEASLSVL